MKSPGSADGAADKDPAAPQRRHHTMDHHIGLNGAKTRPPPPARKMFVFVKVKPSAVGQRPSRSPTSFSARILVLQTGVQEMWRTPRWRRSRRADGAGPEAPGLPRAGGPASFLLWSSDKVKVITWSSWGGRREPGLQRCSGFSTWTSTFLPPLTFPLFQEGFSGWLKAAQGRDRFGFWALTKAALGLNHRHLCVRKTAASLRS